MDKGNIAVIVLAAGKGTRMKSEIPKVLHRLKGRPLIEWVMDSAGEISPERILAVVGFGGDEVRKALSGGRVRFAEQREQLGTAHAVMQATEAMRGFRGRAVILSGDVPLIRPETIRRLIGRAEETGAAAVFLTMEPADPSGYGRVIRRGGEVVSVVEESDADAAQRKTAEVNAGVYLFDCEFLFEALPRVSAGNRQGEFYLTDVLNMAVSSGAKVVAVKTDDPCEALGVNTPEDLEKLEKAMDVRAGREKCPAL